MHTQLCKDFQICPHKFVFQKYSPQTTQVASDTQHRARRHIVQGQAPARSMEFLNLTCKEEEWTVLPKYWEPARDSCPQSSVTQCRTEIPSFFQRALRAFRAISVPPPLIQCLPCFIWALTHPVMAPFYLNNQSEISDYRWPKTTTHT